jgi:hypothetical protein
MGLRPRSRGRNIGLRRPPLIGGPERIRVDPMGLQRNEERGCGASYVAQRLIEQVRRFAGSTVFVV